MLETRPDIPFIKPYGPQHLLVLAVVLGLLWLFVANISWLKRHSRLVCHSLLALQILQTLLLYGWYWLYAGFPLSEALPLHICRISSLLILVFLVNRSMALMDVIFFFGLYAYASFLWPQRIYPLYHALGVSYLINHLITILLPYFAVLALGWRPTAAGLRRGMAAFVGYLTLALLVNPLVDGNYFYIKYRPFAFLDPLPIWLFTLCALATTALLFALGLLGMSAFCRLLDTRMLHTKQEALL